MEKAYFIFKMTGAAMVQPASSDFWKAPLLEGPEIIVIAHHCSYRVPFASLEDVESNRDL